MTRPAFPAAIQHPLLRRLLWVVFAAVFYQSGMTFTVRLLQPQDLGGAMDWLWIAAFPVLLPAFFVVNRRLGCASGACHTGACDLPRRGQRREAGDDRPDGPFVL
jgi:hypothetical protein